MTGLLLALLLPLAVLLGFLGVLLGGKVGHALLVVACVLAGVQVVLVLVGAA